MQCFKREIGIGFKRKSGLNARATKISQNGHHLAEEIIIKIAHSKITKLENFPCVY